MAMQEQPVGVYHTARGDERPPAGYDIYVDGEYAGWVERLHKHRKGSAWRAYLEGQAWPRKFDRPGGYLAAVEWMAEQRRAAKARSEPVTATETASVRVLSPVVSDPFRAEPFADPLAP
jgi:hypothetical protein